MGGRRNKHGKMEIRRTKCDSYILTCLLVAMFACLSSVPDHCSLSYCLKPIPNSFLCDPVVCVEVPH